MATNIQQALAEARAKVSKLEQKEQRLLSKINRKLATLPKQHGFANMEAFIKALRAAAGGGGGEAKSINKVSGSERKPRVVITADTKAKVKALVQAGKTGGEIAKTVGISLPSVQNIKRELGLTRTAAKK